MEDQPWETVSKMLIDGIVSERISIVDAYSFLVTNHPFSQYNNNTFWKRVFMTTDRTPARFDSVKNVQSVLFGDKSYKETINWFRYLLAVNNKSYFHFDQPYRSAYGGPPGAMVRNSELSLRKGTQRQVLKVHIERTGRETRIEINWQGAKNQDYVDLDLLAEVYWAQDETNDTINFSGWGRLHAVRLLYRIMELGWYIEQRPSGRYLRSSISFNEAPLSISSLSFTPSFVTK